MSFYLGLVLYGYYQMPIHRDVNAVQLTADRRQRGHGTSHCPGNRAGRISAKVAGQAVTRRKQILANPNAGEQSYPTGTIILKEVVDASSTISEITAMVKRGGTFNAENNGWEWFMLDPVTRRIAGRGATLMDGMCSSCHSQALDPANGVDYVFKHLNDPFNK